MSKYEFQQIEPQPARGTLREEMWDSPEWIAEEKYDGDRRIAQFCGRLVRFTGRRKSVKDGLFVEKTENVPHLSAKGPLQTGCAGTTRGKHIHDDRCARVPPELEGTVLDGEMISHLDPALGTGNAKSFGGLSKYVTSIMGSLPEEAVHKQIERGWLRYVVFDCLFYKGKDVRHLSLYDRKIRAREALGHWKNPFAVLAQDTGITGPTANKRIFYEGIVARGGEGVILKRKDHAYGDKTGWVKVKKQATADVVIMGFVPAKEMSVKKGADKATITKYAKAGLIGAIQCGQYDSGGGLKVWLREVATVSGMTDDLRERLSDTETQSKWIGKVIEIEHNGREPTGRFRHPRFNRFRDDKAAKDCVYREDES
jgi:ATP-dependent DNA ligase